MHRFAIHRLAIVLLAFVVAVPAGAHEFWISPAAYAVDSAEQIQVTTRIGEKFNAASRPYLPGTFVRFDAVSGAVVLPVEGRIGDDPVQVAPPEGLVVLVYETKDLGLTYSEPGKWAGFVAHKAFPGAMDAHAARGLPEVGFRERYRRFAKSLVAVGHGAGADRALGLRTEIVALGNPYTDGADTLAVRVLFEGAPRVDAQVEMFDRAPDGAVTITLYHTDAAGRAVMPITPGHEYLLDAVHLGALDNDDPAAGPVWETLWASLTFAVPDR